MTSPIRSSFVVRDFYFLALVLACVSATNAAGVLDHLPPDALGFVHIQDLGTTNARIEGFMKLFEVEAPTPLQFVEMSLGMGEGLNTAGDALWVTLPGTSESPVPRPLFILPVADYEKLATSIKGDPSGEICVVTIADTNVLVARKGEYAAFMNVEHRQALTEFMAAGIKPAEAITPLDAWLKGNSGSAVLLPAGVKLLLDLGHAQLAAQEQQMSAAMQDPAMAATKGQLEQGLGFYRVLLEAFGEKANLVAIGATIDENTNVRLAFRVLGKNTGELVPTVSPPTPVSPLAGFPDEPFVFAGGGPVSGIWFERFTAYSIELMQKMPEVYGLADLTTADWEKFRTEYEKLIDDMQLKSMSMVMTTGKQGDPAFGSIYSVVTVADSAKYMDVFREMMKIWNDLMAQSSSKTPFKYELTDKTVGGVKGLEMTYDMFAMMGNDPQMQAVKPMLQAMFGNNGVMRQVQLPVDGQTVVYGMGSDEALQALMDQVKRGETGLQNSTHLLATDKLLSATAPWKMYLSPHGAVEWAKRVVGSFLAMMGQAPTFPEFAPCPPVGITIDLTAERGEADVVWPVESLRALADFIKKCKAL